MAGRKVGGTDYKANGNTQSAGHSKKDLAVSGLANGVSNNQTSKANITATGKGAFMSSNNCNLQISSVGKPQ